MTKDEARKKLKAMADSEGTLPAAMARGEEDPDIHDVKCPECGQDGQVRLSDFRTVTRMVDGGIVMSTGVQLPCGHFVRSEGPKIAF